jgi:hypothetical protein
MVSSENTGNNYKFENKQQYWEISSYPSKQVEQSADVNTQTSNFFNQFFESLSFHKLAFSMRWLGNTGNNHKFET